MLPPFPENAHFPHRMNRDSTIDSICPHCYITIGTSSRESDLAAMEAAHICDPALLQHYQQQPDEPRKPSSRQEPAVMAGDRRSG